MTALVSRRQDTPTVISRRMAQAESDMTHQNEFDYVIINNDLNEAVRQIADIFRWRAAKPKDKEEKMSRTTVDDCVGKCDNRFKLNLFYRPSCARNSASRQRPGGRTQR